MKPLFFTTLKFQLGHVFLAKTEKGLSVAEFLANKKELKEAVGFFETKGIPLKLNRNKFRAEEKLFTRYFDGKEEDFTSLDLDFISGTPFQKKVWLAARKIPYGKTETYKSLAESIDHTGYRSVGQALGRNPLLVVIPCHRVIGSDGNLGGFSSGLELKRFLLRLEGAPIKP
jgi:O-6-methylguanine DNA methyltransferase